MNERLLYPLTWLELHVIAGRVAFVEAVERYMAAWTRAVRR